MQHRQLGSCGLHVSALGLGTMGFGPRTDEATSRRMLSHAVDGGITLVDTADVYGRGIGSGECEQVIGRWLIGSGVRRDQLVLASKVGGPMGGNPNDVGLSARHVRRACEGSLRRLQTDHLDLYQVHQSDPRTSWEETWSEFERLIVRGDVIYVGLSNMSPDELVRAVEAAPEAVRRRIASYQGEHHLGSGDHGRSPARFARLGLGFLAYSPLGGGGLARARSNSEDHALSPWSTIAHRLQQVASEEKRSAAQLAVGWLLADPRVSSVLLGPRTPEQLADLLTGRGRPLASDLLDRVSVAGLES